MFMFASAKSRQTIRTECQTTAIVTCVALPWLQHLTTWARRLHGRRSPGSVRVRECAGAVTASESPDYRVLLSAPSSVSVDRTPVTLACLTIRSARSIWGTPNANTVTRPDYLLGQPRPSHISQGNCRDEREPLVLDNECPRIWTT